MLKFLLSSMILAMSLLITRYLAPGSVRYFLLASVATMATIFYFYAPMGLVWMSFGTAGICALLLLHKFFTRS